MIASFLITFREGLEAAVIVGILLSTLRMMGAYKKEIFIWIGALSGVLMSFIFAATFEAFFGGFTGTAEKIYEGALMFIGFVVITHVIIWLRKYGRTFRKKIEKDVQKALQKKEIWIIAILAFTAVVREGIETVIFLKALSIQSEGTLSLWGGFLGLVAAVSLAGIIFLSSRNISPKKFFQVTGYLLLFIAGGLLAHSVVEFQGAGILPTVMKPVYNLESILSEKEGIGSFLKALFGYDSNPSLFAVIAYILYFSILFSFFHREQRSA